MRWGSDGPQLNVDREAKPLVGRTVFLPREINDHLTAALTDAGAHVHAHPLTRTVLRDMFHVKHALAQIERGSYSWIIITSVRTIKALAAAAAGEPYSDYPNYEPLRTVIQHAIASGTQFAALGRKTTEACERVGASPTVSVEKHATAEDLLAAFTSGPACQYNARALIPASALARPVLADGLANQGWIIDRVDAYTTEPLDSLPAHIGAGWKAGLFDAVVFTAGSNARAAVELLGVPAASTRVVTFGEPSAQAATDAGLHVNAIAPTQDAEGIITALQIALNDKE
ncbi:MAG: uroporphyrinogen-III synthase [Actinomycetaceae bacterium]|nr:uroporphyrinogen-III synthase [Actinomycetaceae bacterium]